MQPIDSTPTPASAPAPVVAAPSPQELQELEARVMNAVILVARAVQDRAHIRATKLPVRKLSDHISGLLLQLTQREAELQERLEHAGL